MSVQFSRRIICKLAASIPIALPIFRFSAATAGNEQSAYIRVKANYAEPLIRKDSLVIVDTRVTRFNGNGIYVYPDWGSPVAYEVIQSNQGALDFYYPGKKSQLWRMNRDNPGAVFSGKAAGVLLPGEDLKMGLTGQLMELQVPPQPLT